MNITRPIARCQHTNYAPKVARVIKTRGLLYMKKLNIGWWSLFIVSQICTGSVVHAQLVTRRFVNVLRQTRGWLSTHVTFSSSSPSIETNRHSLFIVHPYRLIPCGSRIDVTPSAPMKRYCFHPKPRRRTWRQREDRRSMMMRATGQSKSGSLVTRRARSIRPAAHGTYQRPRASVQCWIWYKKPRAPSWCSRRKKGTEGWKCSDISSSEPVETWAELHSRLARFPPLLCSVLWRCIRSAVVVPKYEPLTDKVPATGQDMARCVCTSQGCELTKTSSSAIFLPMIYGISSPTMMPMHCRRFRPMVIAMPVLIF